MMLLITLITLVITYFLTTLFGYVVHWCFHHPWAGRIKTAHLKHHTLYSGEDYLSDDYRKAGKDSTVRLFMLPSILLLALPVLFFYLEIIPWWLSLLIGLEMGFTGWLHNYLHEAFHINGHFLNKIPLIKKAFDHLSHLHYEHHNDMTKNFGICSFIWDRLFHTYKV